MDLLNLLTQLLQNISLTYLIIAILFLTIGSVLGYLARQSIAKKQIGTLEEKIQKRISQAKEEKNKILSEAQQKASNVLTSAKQQEEETRKGLFKKY